MKTLSLTLVCLALSGCMSAGPDFKAPAAAAPADWTSWHGGAPALRSAAPDMAAAPAYARLDDSTLAALQRQALQANHDLRTAALRFAQSRVQRDVAASEQGPQVQASAGAGRQRQSEYGSATRMLGIIAPANQGALSKALSEPFDVFQAGFDTSWEIDLWGRVKRSIEAANARADEGEAVLRQVQLSLAVEVARNYYELRAAQRHLQLARADIAAGSELLELVAARSKGGLGNEIDLARQQAVLASQRAALPGLLEQEALALNRLSLLTGTPPGSLQELLSHGDAAAAPFGSTPDLGLGITADVVARRPDIRAAEAQLHAATAGIGIAKADLYPRLTLGVSLGTEALGGGKFGDWGSRRWSIGPSLSLPLFDGGRRRATVQLRELQQQEAAVHYQKTVLGAWHEVDNALSAYAAEQLRRAQWQVREDSSRSALELSTARYRKGLTDALPVLEARRTLLQAQRERIHSEAALTQRLLAICKAIGVAPLA